MSDETPEVPTSPSPTALPPVKDFEGCNRNFNTLSDYVFGMIGEMKEHREHTQANLTRIAEEVNANVAMLSTDIKAILSSGAMMFCILIIVVSVAVVSVKGIMMSLSHIDFKAIGDFFTHLF